MHKRIKEGKNMKIRISVYKREMVKNAYELTKLLKRFYIEIDEELYYEDKCEEIEERIIGKIKEMGYRIKDEERGFEIDEEKGRIFGRKFDDYMEFDYY